MYPRQLGSLLEASVYVTASDKTQEGWLLSTPPPPHQGEQFLKVGS